MNRSVVAPPELSAGPTGTSWLALIKKRIRNHDDPEPEQALLRVLIGACVLLYLWVRHVSVDAVSPLALWGIVAFLAISAVLLVHICYVRRISDARLYFAMFWDNLANSFFMLLAGEASAWMFGIYLFVAFGNGFRYGRKYLHVSQMFALLGFSAVAVLNPYWGQHIVLGAGFFIWLVILPIYVGVLVQRLDQAKRIAQLAKSKAEEANQAKSRFLAHMSHELRTPLNGVVGMAQLLASAPISPEQKQMVDALSLSAKNMISVVTNILDISKIESGRLEIESVSLCPAEVVLGVSQMMRPSASQRGVELTTEITADAWGSYQGDPHHLQQILINLTSNAIKFTSAGSVHLRVMPAILEGGSQALRFEVEDTGIGIAPDKLDAIFESFVQADNSTTRKFGGTGLGTTIAKQLTELMGGRIGVRSDVGIGSTFWVELPFQLISTGAPKSEDRPNADVPTGDYSERRVDLWRVTQKRGLRVLVAEDTQTNQEVLRLMLERSDHQVTITSDGAEALDRLQTEAFDLAILDYNMPELTGVEVLKLYRISDPDGCAVILLSADATPETVRIAHSAGVADFLTKPVDYQALVSSIDQITCGGSPRPANVTRLPSEIEFPSSTDRLPVLREEKLQQVLSFWQSEARLSAFVKGFENDAEICLRELKDAASVGHARAVAESAHKFAGGAGNLGASRLEALCRRVMKLQPIELRSSGNELVAEIDREYRAFHAALTDALAKER